MFVDGNKMSRLAERTIGRSIDRSFIRSIEHSSFVLLCVYFVRDPYEGLTKEEHDLKKRKMAVNCLTDQGLLYARSTLNGFEIEYE